MASVCERTPNGATPVQRVPRKDSGFRKPSKNIVAIDFGTKNVSLAYITESDNLSDTVLKLPLNGTHLRVPTAILLNADGEVDSFGYDARKTYNELEDSQRESYFYFEEIKMKLQLEREVSREMKVKALNGKEFFLVDVIAQILKYLKDEFLKQHLKYTPRRDGQPYNVADFDWVITVPAIWRARGKQMMREAGYKAGLCSRESCGRLRVASTTSPDVPTELSPDKLSLALEPESAAIYCHDMLQRKKVASYCHFSEELDTPRNYLIVDVGGGTVDISVHKVSDSPDQHEVEELHAPVGNDWGGTRVNQQFYEFLEDLVNDPGFSRYTETCDPEVNARNKCHLNTLVNERFEEAKQAFGRYERRREVVVELPSLMFQTYEDDLKKGVQRVGNSQVKLVRQDLRISTAKMEEFMEPSVAGILECIEGLLQRLETRQENIDAIYLVGGYGGSRYIYQKVVEKFGHQYKCIVPRFPEFAVVEGAVLFRGNPSVVRARKADATYGKSAILQFNRQIHDHQRRKVDDDGIPRCHDIFRTVVEVGETVNPEYVYMFRGVPLHHDQKNMCIEMYSSPEKAEGIWYVEGERSGGAVKIGELTVEMPDPTGDKSREVEFTVDFSHTEIQVKGYDITSGNEVKTVMDFLSAQ